MIKYTINADIQLNPINKNIYGHFSEHLGRCIYEGLWVGKESTIPHVNGIRQDVVEALKKIKLPLLRWPGGCFADEYHWKDGIGDPSKRKKMINTHWGGMVEDNSFGTHEFMELCRQIECDPYINGNLGSGTVQEMSEWIEYMTFNGISPMSELRKENGQDEAWKVKYFGVGNENWGCGGNMRPEYYADEYRRYQTYVRNFEDNNIYKIACGASGADYHWTEVLMKEAGRFMNGLSLHYYTVLGTWQNKTSATGFNEADYYKMLQKTLFMEELLTKHSEIMDKYDPEKKVGLIVDEWGSWYDVEVGTNPGFLYQQNTMRDAMIAGINLNLFNKHSDRVQMANIAQLVNVLQSLILTEGEKMIVTPTYHVFDMYKEHQAATLIASEIQEDYAGEEKVKNLTESVSIDEAGKIHITICNIDLNEEKRVEAEVKGFKINKVSGKILSQDKEAHNTFDEPHKVQCKILEGTQLTDKGLKFTIPKCSIVKLTLE